MWLLHQLIGAILGNWHYTSELLAVPVFRVLRAFRVRTCQVTATYRLMPEDTSNRVVLAGTFEQGTNVSWNGRVPGWLSIVNALA